MCKLSTKTTQIEIFCRNKFELCENRLAQVLLVSVVFDKFNLNLAGNFPRKRNSITQKNKVSHKKSTAFPQQAGMRGWFCRSHKNVAYCRTQPQLRKGFPHSCSVLANNPHAAYNKTTSQVSFSPSTRNFVFRKKLSPKAAESNSVAATPLKKRVFCHSRCKFQRQFPKTKQLPKLVFQ